MRWVESTSVDVVPKVLDRKGVKGVDSMLCFSTSPASSETSVEVCDHVGVTVRVRGMISGAEPEAGSRRHPLNRGSFERILSLRGIVGRFLSFFLRVSRS